MNRADDFQPILATKIFLQSSVWQITDRLVAGFNGINVTSAHFMKLKNPAISGGAILCFAPVQLVNCMFENCEAKNGGAIADHSHFKAKFVTFRNCRAILNAGCVYHLSKYLANFYLNYSVFANSKSAFFGSFLKRSNGVSNIESVNVTNSYAQECVGSVEIESGTNEIKYLTFDKSKVTAHNGCSVFRSPTTFHLSYSIFKNCEHRSFVEQAAAALLMYYPCIGANIENCYFVNNVPADSFTVSICDRPLTISNCHFTGDQRKEINPRNAVVNECTFNSDFEISPFPEAVIGFQHNIKGLDGDERINFDQLINSVSISLLCGLMVAILFTFMHTRFQSVYSKLTKTNRAVI